MSGRRLAFPLRLGLVVLAHPSEVGWDQAERVLASASLDACGLQVSLTRAPCVVSDAGTAARAAQALRGQDLQALCVIPATWSADDPLLDLLEALSLPVVVWGMPGVETGSLCGSHQINCVLREMGRACHLVYGPLGDAGAQGEVARFARAAALASELRHAKIGLVGYRTPGMFEIAFDEWALKSVLGPRVVHQSLEEFGELMKKADTGAAHRELQTLVSRVGAVEVGEDELASQARALAALRLLVGEQDLCGVAFECYPNWMGRVCVPFSLLAEEGLAAGCEGDVNGTTALLMLQWLAQAPGHNTDLLAVNEQENTILLSHCGNSALSLASAPSEARVASVRLAGEGACLLFPAKPGPVTLVNLVGGRNTYRLAALVGEAVPTGMDFPGCPLRVRLPLPVRDFPGWVGEEALGHHWMAAYGDFSVELRHFCRLVGVRHVSLS